MGEDAGNHRIALIKLRYRRVLLDAFIQVENMNVKKFRATKSNIIIFSQVSLK